MRKIKIAFIFVFIISLIGCSIINNNTFESENASQNQNNKKQYATKSIDLFNMDRQTRIKLGITLKYSPNRAHFFITDKYGSDFTKIYLYEKGKKEVEIFDFYNFFGEEEIRDMIDIRLFWGGKSDKIYLHVPFLDTPKLWSYSLSKHKWERVNIPSEQKINFIISIDNTDKLLIREGEKYYKYYLFDVIEQTKEELEELVFPEKFLVLDQNNSNILVCQYLGDNSKEHYPIYRLGIYDIKQRVLKYLKIPSPIHLVSPYAIFVPNSNGKISYMVTLKDLDNKVTSVLVIYDITSGDTEIIPIGKGEKTFIGWDYKGNSFYGTDYLMIMTQENRPLVHPCSSY